MTIGTNVRGVRGVLAAGSAQPGDVLVKVCAKSAVELADFEGLTAAVSGAVLPRAPEASSQLRCAGRPS